MPVGRIELTGQLHGFAPVYGVLAVSVARLARIAHRTPVRFAAGIDIGLQSLVAERSCPIGNIARKGLVGSALGLKQKNPADPCAVKASTRAFYHFQAVYVVEIEGVEGRAARRICEGYFIPVYLDVAHAEWGPEKAAPDAEAVTGRGALLHPDAGQGVHCAHQRLILVTPQFAGPEQGIGSGDFVKAPGTFITLNYDALEQVGCRSQVNAMRFRARRPTEEHGFEADVGDQDAMTGLYPIQDTCPCGIGNK